MADELYSTLKARGPKIKIIPKDAREWKSILTIPPLKFVDVMDSEGKVYAVFWDILNERWFDWLKKLPFNPQCWTELE